MHLNVYFERINPLKRHRRHTRHHLDAPPVACDSVSMNGVGVEFYDCRCGL
jgi:hypothetical protein